MRFFASPRMTPPFCHFEADFVSLSNLGGASRLLGIRNEGATAAAVAYPGRASTCYCWLMGTSRHIPSGACCHHNSSSDSGYRQALVSTNQSALYDYLSGIAQRKGSFHSYR